jgi:hypothetical protein
MLLALTGQPALPKESAQGGWVTQQSAPHALMDRCIPMHQRVQSPTCGGVVSTDANLRIGNDHRGKRDGMQTPHFIAHFVSAKASP